MNSVRHAALLVAFWLSLVATHVRAGKPPDAAVVSVGITVRDIERSSAFYEDVLDFVLESEESIRIDGLDAVTGLTDIRARRATLRLGEERLCLTEYESPRGADFPADPRSNDCWFQHIAIIVSDMDAAYQRLEAAQAMHASPEPQRLPDWNRNAGGIRAYYFRDPDGHFLEVLQFPPDKGAEKWRQPSDDLFLGIDHTAIVVADTAASLEFYRERLGLQVVGTSENYGPEQSRLNNVAGAHLRITTLRGTSGPGIELLEYLAPRGGRVYPTDAEPNDLVHWQTNVMVSGQARLADELRRHDIPFVSGDTADQTGWIVRDPDGHAVQILERQGEE